MNDNRKPGRGMVGLRIFHGFVMAGTGLIIVLACISIYLHVGPPAWHTKDANNDNPVSEGQGQTKPLPDYMLEDVGPDELEYLKP